MTLMKNKYRFGPSGGIFQQMRIYIKSGAEQSLNAPGAPPI